jgi:hypothetical protein
MITAGSEGPCAGEGAEKASWKGDADEDEVGQHMRRATWWEFRPEFIKVGFVKFIYEPGVVECGDDFGEVGSAGGEAFGVADGAEIWIKGEGDEVAKVFQDAGCEC